MNAAGWRRSRRNLAIADDSAIRLESIGVAISPLLIENRLIRQLISEDVGWQAAVTAWQSRSPSFWDQTARSAWRDEGMLLAAKRDRIADLARSLGVAAESR